MSAERFTIRRARPEDRSDIIRLVSEMQGSDATDRLDWFYRGNPHGDAVSWVAVDGESGCTEAVTSIFPRRVLLDGAERLGSIGGDCYVAPAARRQGIATRLHVATRQEMREAGVEFMYGPPLVNNLKALLKAGSRAVTVFRRYVRPLRDRFWRERLREVVPAGRGSPIPDFALGAVSRSAFLALRREGPDVRGHALEEVRAFDTEWDRFVRSVGSRCEVCCVRDAAYLNFRYPREEHSVRRPYLLRRSGALMGMFVLDFDLAHRSAFLVDMFAPGDMRSTRAALELASRVAADRECDALHLRTTPHPLVTDCLSSLGFLERDRDDPWVFQVLVGEGTRDVSTLFRAPAWYFFDGDQDMSAGVKGPVTAGAAR